MCAAGTRVVCVISHLPATLRIKRYAALLHNIVLAGASKAGRRYVQLALAGNLRYERYQLN
jgi:hypothetical protein